MLHSFQYLNASLLITNGVDVKTDSTTLGHSQVSTTTSIYANIFEKVQAAASEAITSALPLNLTCKPPNGIFKRNKSPGTHIDADSRA
ncbi:MAG: hypothetical protein E7569_02725 [Ruminococcaceae bacterium]|nr:hypothetical protein [Oscillospiraceae bacterium]